MKHDSRKIQLIERALRFACFQVQPRPQHLLWELEGHREYRLLPFALCYKLEPGEERTGVANELIALERRMTVEEALRTLSTIEVEAFLTARTGGKLLLEDDPYFNKIRVSALFEPPYYYFTQAISEFPVAWERSGFPRESWKALDKRTKVPKHLTGRPKQEEPNATDASTTRMDALEFIAPTEAELALLPKNQAWPTFTTVPEEAQVVTSIPQELAEAIHALYGDMAKARSWPKKSPQSSP